MEEPHKHHYLPVFYLKRWQGADRQVSEFKKVYGGVIKKQRMYPIKTGYKKFLYSMDGIPDDVAHSLEKIFMSPVDSHAAEALEILLGDYAEHVWTSSQRTGWTRFLLSLLVRMPEDVEKLKQLTTAYWNAAIGALEARFNLLKPSDNNETFAEFYERELALILAQSVLNNFETLVNHQNVGQSINNMMWKTFWLDHADNTLLTSDRPLILPGNMGSDDAYLCLPVGPRRLFVATNTAKPIDMMMRLSDSQIVNEINRVVVENASHLVIGDSDVQLGFVRDRFGQGKAPTMLERLESGGAFHFDESKLPTDNI